MQSLVLRLGLCHRGLHLWHSRTEGKRSVTMATNFGTKIAINAYKCISMRDNQNAITDNRGFLWSINPKKTFLLAQV